MSSIPFRSDSELVPILKGKVKYYNTTAKNIKEERDELETLFVKAIVASKNKEMLLAYVADNAVFKHLKDGSILGVCSKIGTYTNKKGVSHQAHFTINGNYLFPVGKEVVPPFWCLNERDVAEPIGYAGWFKINDHLDKFDIVFDTDATTIADLFFQNQD
jgi:hypothetical protein